MKCHMYPDSIIIGGNHHNTLGVIRALGLKGIYSTVVLVTDEQNPYVSYSKYIKTCVILKNKQKIAPWLVEHSKHLQCKAVIFSCADFVTSELDKFYNELNYHYHLPTANGKDVCNHYMNKDVMATLANKVGIFTPPSWIIEEYTNHNLNEVDFPCIVKPLASIYGTKAEIKIFQEKSSLEKYLSENKGLRFIIQKYIEKDFEYQLIGCSLNHGTEIIIPGYSKCIRPCPGTNTGFLEYKPMNGFNCDLKACKEFIKHIGYQGLFSMEYLRDKQGNDYFMEINMRNDGNGICVTGAGMNLPYIWYQYCIEGDYKTEISNKINDIYVMPEFDDFMLVLKRNVSLRTWWKDYKRTATFMEYCKMDPKPYYVRRKQFVKHLFKKIVHPNIKNI